VLWHSTVKQWNWTVVSCICLSSLKFEVNFTSVLCSLRPRIIESWMFHVSVRILWLLRMWAAVKCLATLYVWLCIIQLLAEWWYPWNVKGEPVCGSAWEFPTKRRIAEQVTYAGVVSWAVWVICNWAARSVFVEVLPGRIFLARHLLFCFCPCR
jgi:hypothetical protein